MKIYRSAPKQCSYLPRNSENLYILSAGGDLYSNLLERGWRRFGSLFFRPDCGGCEECSSARINVQTFEPTRSMRRVISRCEPLLRLSIDRPKITAERLSLYKRYHKDRSAARGWDVENITPCDYYDYFVDHALDYGYEFAYYRQDRLAAIALVDILPSGISAVYCYYDPELKSLSLGTYSILKQIMFAKEHNLRYLYLGYLVAGNQSLAYKARFKPSERLAGRPSINEEPVWL